MKASLILAAAFAFATSAAYAQTTPGTTTTTTTSQPGTMGTGTMNNGTMRNGTMNSTTDRMGDMNGVDKSTMRNNRRMSKKGMKTKTDANGNMKAKTY